MTGEVSERRLRWSSSGEGSAILLIQGLGYPSAMWFRLAPLLVGHRVISFDNRGIGHNAGLGIDRLSIEMMAADARSVAEAAGEKTVTVLGTSLGGIVAQELALSSPAIVDRLVLLSTHTADERAIWPDDEVTRMYGRRSRTSGEQGLRLSAPFAYAPTTDPTLIDEDIAVRAAWPEAPLTYDAQREAVAAYRGTWARLPEIEAETLVVHGPADRIVPVGNATIVADRIPTSRRLILDDGGHNLFSERAADVAEAVLGFLRQADQRS